MNITVTYRPEAAASLPVEIDLPLSKSLSNRRLIIDALAGVETQRNAVAVCDDTEAMLSALADGKNADVNIGAAGTAMRFLTAYYASQPGYDVTLDGSERMRQRPIGILVDALRQAGADITYLGRDGYPPLHIRGRILEGGSIEIDAGVSSQYTSALLMVAPTMTLGMELTLKGTPVSQPYIKMTIAMMARRGVTVIERPVDNSDYEITVAPSRYKADGDECRVEADWSAASYWYEIAAITGRSFTLKGLKRRSLQGDACVSDIFAELGVSTRYNDNDSVTISGNAPAGDVDSIFEADLQLCPDLAQTVVATCCALGRRFRITGLSTLPIKETDRLEALRCELAKLGYMLEVHDGNSIEWNGAAAEPQHVPEIKTYNDHRMAMALAPLAATRGPLVIMSPEVVSKSYPDFWKHISGTNYIIENQ